MWINLRRGISGRSQGAARAWRGSATLGLILIVLWLMLAAGSGAAPPQQSGVNLVPIARSFSIQVITFGSNYHSVRDGCVTPGRHRIMRFEFAIGNIGTEDAFVGDPLDHPELFAYSVGHGHYHVKDFNEFKLLDKYGRAVLSGTKQGFCLVDTERVDPEAGPAQYGGCEYQGISAGWADVYTRDLACQFIVIGDIPDGEYTLRSTTNAQHVIAESDLSDNTTYTDLRIYRGKVTVIRVHEAESWIPGNGRRPPRR